MMTLAMLSFTSCTNNTKAENDANKSSSREAACDATLPKRFAAPKDTSVITASRISHEGMVFISAGKFMMGASDKDGSQDEYPRHEVKLSSFWIDITEVTNAQFEKFVDATGYITTAERKADWLEIQKQLPSGTTKPPESQLAPASLVFFQPKSISSLTDPSQWWHWTKGANWRHPQGPGSDIKGKEEYPVVQVSWEDAMAYCKWDGKRLPTEAEWEYAARGKLKDGIYPWGNEPITSGRAKANTWQGNFPLKNNGNDGFDRLAPVKKFAPNGFGLYDLAGNVWEWCNDWYQPDHYYTADGLSHDPQGPQRSHDSMEPEVPKKVVRGGSFLCNASYCKGYRVSSRMKTSPDTGLEHTGFRCVSSN